MKRDAQAIYLAPGRSEAEQAFRVFRARWQLNYPVIVKRLEQDLPELLADFSLPPISGGAGIYPLHFSLDNPFLLL